MKKLLLIAALVSPTWLYSCMPKAPVPTPADVIREVHEAFPIPEVQIPELPADLTPPAVKQVKPRPAPKRPVVKRKAVPVPTPRPIVKTEEEPQPPLECIFPLNIIPTCTPQTVDRMP
jgi:hypothetical protein